MTTKLGAVPTTSCYGGRATRALRTILKPGTRLTLATDANLPNKDTDGALLRYATRGTTNMNRLIIQRGIAVPYFPNGKRGRLAARLLNDARTARATNRGLWAACPNAQLTPLHGSATGPA